MAPPPVGKEIDGRRSGPTSRPSPRVPRRSPRVSRRSPRVSRRSPRVPRPSPRASRSSPRTGGCAADDPLNHHSRRPSSSTLPPLDHRPPGWGAIAVGDRVESNRALNPDENDPIDKNNRPSNRIALTTPPHLADPDNKSVPPRSPGNALCNGRAVSAPGEDRVNRVKSSEGSHDAALQCRKRCKTIGPCKPWTPSGRT
jgi:hypothetical protein